MVVFTFLVIFCLVSALITYGLGVFVFAKNPSSTVNRLFLATMLAATYWALGEFFIWQATGYDEVWFWLKASAFWPLVAALTAHFILAFTGHPLAKEKKTWHLLIALYLPALLIALVEILTGQIYTVGYEPGTGYVYLPVSASPAYQIEAIYVTLVMVTAAYISITAWRRAQPGKIRRQNRLVGIGIATVIGFGFLSGILLPAYRIYTPNLVFIGIVIFSLLIVYAVHKYGLFVLSPETAVPDIIRTMPDGLVLADMDGRIITTNRAAAEIFGIAESDLPGRSVGTLIPETAYASIRATITEQGRLSDREALLEGKEETYVSIAGSLVKDPDAEPVGIVLIIRDITGRKASERALRIAGEKISLLTRLTRHDIGNLLTALSWYLTLLQEDRASPAGDAYLSSSIDLVGKITRHLQFSRDYQEIGLHQPIWQPLESLITQAVDDLPLDSVSITSRVMPVEIYTDPLSVKVIYNLLENALRHGDGLTEIRIATEEERDGSLIVAFEDNGAGIGDAEKEKIFRYGYGKNTGLGLAFSRDILSITGIGIAETGTAGRGARFELQVPSRAWRPLGEADKGA
ncbi:histidine kinase [Methanoculleus taiwanensis]|uniref:Histidine kinase n=2 Tax=Methanoculleus taiwanensis TaxID=1550565 RepID=A0A498H004_9EURY|nr:histidine kinase [Methanoculleus taiwanensis]